MKTVTGFEVENPRELLLGFVHHWYPLYDGVEVAEDSELRVSEIALSTMLNSRISGNTGGAIWREARLEVSEALRSVRVGMDLLDMLPTDLAPDEPGISRAITAICNVHRSKLAVATKILHKKRPGLIAIFDSVVEGHYHPRWCPTVTARSWGDYAVALTRLVHKDMLSIDAELQELRCLVGEKGTPMTGCRIFNALMWAVLSKNEGWLRKLAHADRERQ